MEWVLGNQKYYSLVLHIFIIIMFLFSEQRKALSTPINICGKKQMEWAINIPLHISAQEKENDGFKVWCFGTNLSRRPKF